MITLSTGFTIIRIILVPFVVLTMISHQWGVAAALFIMAAVTDIIDGKLARMRNEITPLGASLDPVADKCLLLSTYFTLSFIESPLFIIPHWFVYMVLAKEFLQIGGVMGLFFLKKRPVIEATFLGKLTTVIQVAFIIWLFMCYFMHWLPVKTYYCALGFVLLLIGLSFIEYAKIGYRIFIGQS